MEASDAGADVNGVPGSLDDLGGSAGHPVIVQEVGLRLSVLVLRGGEWL